jgi:hypothetical protein
MYYIFFLFYGTCIYQSTTAMGRKKKNVSVSPIALEQQIALEALKMRPSYILLRGIKVNNADSAWLHQLISARPLIIRVFSFRAHHQGEQRVMKAATN